ncbi:CHCHD7 (predicted) [Pycnogonum litorale]
MMFSVNSSSSTTVENGKKQRRDIKKLSQQHREQINNPCFQEQDLSFKCLNDSGYDYSKCEMHFLNYRQCKKFWGAVVKERMQKNIQPYLPNPEDQEEIKNEYLKKLHEDLAS